MSTNDNSLFGHWEIDPSDIRALDEFGSVGITFFSRGELMYTIRGDLKDEIINMTYRVDGNRIVTNQPSSPREEITTFEFSEDGRLILDHGGVKARYVRVRGN